MSPTLGCPGFWAASVGLWRVGLGWGEEGSRGLDVVGVLAPRWCWFDLSLLSSQHLVASGLPWPNPRLHNSPQIRTSQFPHCTVSFPCWKSHFPGRAEGSALLPSLARCHLHRQSHPIPPPEDPSTPPSISRHLPQFGPGSCCLERVGEGAVQGRR